VFLKCYTEMECNIAITSYWMFGESTCSLSSNDGCCIKV